MKRKKNVAGMWILSVILFFSCITTEGYENPEVELQTLWNEFAASWNALDAQSCALFYAEDAVNIPPELPVNTGRESIEQFYGWLFSMHQSAKYEHQIQTLSYSENHVIELGEFQVDWVTTDGSAWIYKARSLTHWEKDENKNWKIRTFVFNTPPADY